MDVIDRVKDWFNGGEKSLPYSFQGAAGIQQMPLFATTGLLLLAQTGTAGSSYESLKDAVVSAACTHLFRALSLADLQVVDARTGDKEEGRSATKALKLLQKPEGGWTFNDLIQHITYSMIGTGNSFLRISRDYSMLEVLPSFEVDYKTHRGGEYIFTVNGKHVSVPCEEVVHLRYHRVPGVIWGLSPITDDVAREIYINRMAQVHAAAMLENAGTAGVILTPNKEHGAADQRVIERMNEAYKELRAQGAGDPWILRDSWDVHHPPPLGDRVDVTTVRNEAVTRILAPLGVTARMIGVGAQGVSGGTGADRAHLMREFWEKGVMPLGSKIASQLTTLYLSKFMNTDRFVFEFNYADIPAIRRMQGEAMEERVKTSVTAYQGGVWGLAEARQWTDAPDAVPDDLLPPELQRGVKPSAPEGPRNADTDAAEAGGTPGSRTDDF